MAYNGDRFGYQRFSMFPPVIKWLIIANVAIYILGMLPAGTLYGEPVTLENYFTLYGALWPFKTVLGSLDGLHPFGIWQYFTYMFLHGGFFHIFFNMLVLWMFGIELEQVWGSKRFLIYYLLCGLGAGLIHSIVTMLIGQNAPTVGASGAIMGVMIAFGLMFPDRIIFVVFFPMRAKYAVLLITALDLYQGFIGTDDVAHFAHLGGALVGYLLLKTSGLFLRGGLFKSVGATSSGPSPTMDAFRPVEQPQTPPRNRIIDVDFREVSHRETPRHVPPRMDFGDDQARIDAILDKISHEGYQNLTEEEKAILIQASRKMR